MRGLLERSRDRASADQGQIEATLGAGGRATSGEPVARASCEGLSKPSLRDGRSVKPKKSKVSGDTEANWHGAILLGRAVGLSKFGLLCIEADIVRTRREATPIPLSATFYNFGNGRKAARAVLLLASVIGRLSNGRPSITQS